MTEAMVPKRKTSRSVATRASAIAALQTSSARVADVQKPFIDLAGHLIWDDPAAVGAGHISAAEAAVEVDSVVAVAAVAVAAVAVADAVPTFASKRTSVR